MKPEPNWNKISAITGIVGAAAGMVGLLVAAAAYLFPRDPAHPASFDFLSRSITVPLWLVVLALSIWLIGIMWPFWRRQPDNGEGISHLGSFHPPKADVLQKPISDQSSPRISEVPATQSVSAIPWEDLLGQTIIPSGDHIVLRIRREELGGPQKGLVLQVINNRLESIAGQRISIVHAVSFDRWHGAFRQEVDFKPFVGNIDDVLTPSSVSKGMWIIRSEPSTPNLIAGNTSSSELLWPKNDDFALHKWKLSIKVDALQISKSTIAKSFEPIVFDLIVVWNKETNEFVVEEATKS